MDCLNAVWQEFLRSAAFLLEGYTLAMMAFCGVAVLLASFGKAEPPNESTQKNGERSSNVKDRQRNSDAGSQLDTESAVGSEAVSSRDAETSALRGQARLSSDGWVG